jgi:osmotically-inducible protein OsmY
MTIDRELQQNVLAALEWEAGLDAARIGVSVNDGVVTLQGTVTTLREKWLAERAARHVRFVRAVANDIDVVVGDVAHRTDPDIAEAAANALEWDSAVPDGTVKVTVRHGWITLTGTVNWQYQKATAERVVGRLNGVKGVANSIIVRPAASVGDVRANIERAFQRSAEIDARQVQIDTQGGTVTLTGTVQSLSERDEAERAAWAAPGVTHVHDQLVVAPPHRTLHALKGKE